MNNGNNQAPTGGQLVQPMPCSVSLGILPILDDNNKSVNLVIMQVETIAGTTFAFLEQEQALNLGVQLKGIAKQAKTGLTLPANALMDDDENA